MTALWTFTMIVIAMFLMQHFLRGRPIGHGFLLTFGILFYLVAPFFAFGSGVYAGGPGEAAWAVAFEALYRQSGLVMGLSLMYGVAFVVGQALPLPRNSHRFDRPIRTQVLIALLFALLAIWAYYLVQARDLLFSGYVLAYRPDLMGPLATVSLVAVLVFLNLSQWRQSLSLMWGFGFLLATNSVALLSMGGRLYVAATLVALGLGNLNRIEGRSPLARARSLALALLVIVGLALIGLWRIDAEIDAQALLQILLAEGVLNTISLGTLLDCSFVDVLSTPANYLSSIINFVPSALLPEKESLMVELDPSGNCLSAPFGATHLGTALIVNFGILGSGFIVMIFAYGMKAIKGTGGGWWLYYYLCSLLPFMLFRDGFLIFNKAFIGIGLLTASLLVLLSPRQRGELGSRRAVVSADRLGR